MGLGESIPASARGGCAKKVKARPIDDMFRSSAFEQVERLGASLEAIEQGGKSPRCRARIEFRKPPQCLVNEFPLRDCVGHLDRQLLHAEGPERAAAGLPEIQLDKVVALLRPRTRTPRDNDPCSSVAAPCSKDRLDVKGVVLAVADHQHVSIRDRREEGRSPATIVPPGREAARCRRKRRGLTDRAVQLDKGSGDGDERSFNWNYDAISLHSSRLDALIEVGGDGDGRSAWPDKLARHPAMEDIRLGASSRWIESEEKLIDECSGVAGYFPQDDLERLLFRPARQLCQKHCQHPRAPASQ
ncbi:MAG TPA: hypothetical protein VGM94_01535 [Galbitalea sp.]